MREILFRGQTRRYGEQVWMNGEKVPSNWVYGGICQGKGDFSIIYGSMDVELEQPTEKRVVYTDTIGQYTGLTDKNGKKIFEGDIVKIGGDNLPYWMKNEEFKAVEYVSDGFSPFNEYDNDCGTFLRAKDCEVIGNIHDNPELLEGSEGTG